MAASDEDETKERLLPREDVAGAGGLTGRSIACVFSPYGIVASICFVINLVALGEVFDRRSPYYTAGDPAERAADVGYKASFAAFALLLDVLCLCKVLRDCKKDLKRYEDEEKKEEKTQGEERSQKVVAQDNDSSDTPLQKELDDAATPNTKKKPGLHVPKRSLAIATRKFDAFLFGSCAPKPKVPTLIGLLYASIVASLAFGLGCSGIVAYTSTSMTEKDCLLTLGSGDIGYGSPEERLEYDEIPHKIIQATTIPEGLQPWAVSFTKGGMQDIPATFVHLSDGRTFFVGTLSRERFTLDDDPDRFMPPKRILLETGADGSIKKHEDILDPAMFTSFLGSRADGSVVETFCCLYYPPEYSEEDVASRRRQAVVDTIQTPQTKRLLCSSPDHDGLQSVSIPDGIIDPNIQQHRSEAFKAHEGSLWYGSKWSDYNQGPRRSMEFYRVDFSSSSPTQLVLTSNFTIKSWPEFAGMERIESVKRTPCISWIPSIPGLLAAAVTILAAVWLVYCKGVMAGVGPVSLVGYYLACTLIDDDVAFYFTFILLLSSAILITFGRHNDLTRKWTMEYHHREALIWAHYSIVPYLAFLTYQERWARIILCWCIFLGAVVMNHKTLEIGGYYFGSYYVCEAIYRSIVFHGRGIAYSVFVSMPMGIVIGIGMISIGSYIQQQKYHCAPRPQSS